MLTNKRRCTSLYSKIIIFFVSISIFSVSSTNVVRAETWVGLTGEVPYRGDDPLAICKQIIVDTEPSHAKIYEFIANPYVNFTINTPWPPIPQDPPEDEINFLVKHCIFECTDITITPPEPCFDRQIQYTEHDIGRICDYSDEYGLDPTTCQTCPNTDEQYDFIDGICKTQAIDHVPLTDSNCKQGNPCNVATGEKTESHTDYDDGWLTFTRQYHSRVHTHEPKMGNFLGEGWTHNYSDHLVIDPTEGVQGWIRGDGYHEPMAEKESSTGEYVSSSNSKLDSELIDTGSGYQVRRGSTVDTFDTNGDLLYRVIEGGHILMLGYNTSGLLETITDEAGRSLTLNYVNGRLDTLTTPLGDITYQYDNNDNLEFVNYPDGSSIQYHYENTSFQNHLTGITDERGNRSYYSYDSRGKAINTTPVGGVGELLFDYDTHEDDERIQTTVKDYNPISQTLADVTEYNFTPGMRHIHSIVEKCEAGDTRCTGTSTITNYWDGDNLIAKDDNGLVTEYGDYDEIGRYHYMIEAGLTPEQHADTNITYSSDARRIDFEYHDVFINKVTKRIEHSVANSNASGTQMNSGISLYDKCDVTLGHKCKVTSSVYNTDGNLTSLSITGYDVSGNALTPRTTTWQYNGPYGQVSFMDGPRLATGDIYDYSGGANDHTTFEYYDSNTSGHQKGRLKKIILENGDNDITTRHILEYSATGKVLREERPNNHILIYDYYPGNDRLRILTETNGIDERKTYFEYENTGEVKLITQAYQSPDASTTTFQYDAAGQLERITDDVGNYIRYVYDDEGNQTFEKIYEVGGVEKRSVEQTYDRFNRLDKTHRFHNSDDHNFEVDGTLTNMVDGRNIETQYQYDELRRLIETIQDATTIDARTQYVYDVADRLVKVTDPETLSTTYQYDDLGNLLVETSPDTNATVYTYDAAGNRTSKLDQNRATASLAPIRYHYDSLNRLTLVDYDKPYNYSNIIYEYDDSATFGSQNGIGRLTKITKMPDDVNTGAGNFIMIETYHYDYLGNMDFLINRLGSYEHYTFYEFNLRDELTYIQYPSARGVEYHRNSIGQIDTVTLLADGTSTDLVTNVQYLPFGPMKAFTLGNGITETRTYDEDYRLHIQATGTLQNLTYGYDASNNLDDIQDNLDSNPTQRDRAFDFDGLNRLDLATIEGGVDVFDYGYDKVGNRTGLNLNGTNTSYAYEANSHRLSDIQSPASNLQSYDAVGNLTNNGELTFTYDEENRIVDVDHPTQSLNVDYQYNSRGQRVKRIANGLDFWPEYHYDSSGNLLTESYSHDGKAYLTDYVYLNGELVTKLVRENTSVGNNSDNTISGNLYRDVIEGGNGNDTLNGQLGDDVLIGGPGNDLLIGGHGNDVYHFDGGWGSDKITNKYGDRYQDTIRFGPNITRNDIDISVIEETEVINFFGITFTQTVTSLYLKHNTSPNDIRVAMSFTIDEMPEYNQIHQIIFTEPSEPNPVMTKEEINNLLVYPIP